MEMIGPIVEALTIAQSHLILLIKWFDKKKKHALQLLKCCLDLHPKQLVWTVEQMEGSYPHISCTKE